jgi:hypothetical protein
MRRHFAFLATLASLLIASLALPGSGHAQTPAFEIQSIDLQGTQVEGSRGAALGIGRDGTLYLGGGGRGDTLFAFSEGSLQSLGKISTQKERLRDSRFGPTDVAILSEGQDHIDFLISYPQLSNSGKCVRLVVFRYRLNQLDNQATKVRLTKKERWFRGNPCVPVGAVQHAAGRIEIIDEKSAYLTTGDLGFRKINDRSARGLLGGVFKISARKVEQISEGHRNPQGILLVGKNLYISEHGPRGGDEINLIESGKDYGWPFVTLGAAYGSGDYVRPENPGSHQGYEKPLIAWVPSVAPTELVQLPTGSRWGDLQESIVMGTLAEESLIFLRMKSSKEIAETQREYIGERIRDLEIGADGELVASTDSGKVLLITRKN